MAAPTSPSCRDLPAQITCSVADIERLGVTIQYSGQGRERLVTATAATSDGNGAITFRQGPCPLGFVWQGSVTVTNAPSGALFNATVASTPWGQWAGPTNFGPVQLWGNETLVVTGIGLQKNTQYSMLFFGVAMPEELAEPLPPVAPLSTVSVETSTLLVNAQTFSGAGSVILTPSSLTRRLTVVVASGSTLDTLVALVGRQSNAVYGSGTFNSVDGPTVFYFAIEPTIDQTYTLSFSGTVSCTAWVTANTTSPLVKPGAPIAIVQPVAVTGPFGAPINVAGSPVGPFNLTTGVQNKAVGNNQSVIAAPGAGNSVYIQSVTVWNTLIAAAALAEGQFIAGSGGAGVVDIVISPPNRTSETVTFPGGYELPTNTGLFVNVFTNSVFYVVTYAVGVTI